MYLLDDGFFFLNYGPVLVLKAGNKKIGFGK